MTVSKIWKYFMSRSLKPIKKADSRLVPIIAKEIPDACATCDQCGQKWSKHTREKTDNGVREKEVVLFNLNWFKPASTELIIHCPEDS